MFTVICLKDKNEQKGKFIALESVNVASELFSALMEEVSN